ncbi:RNA-binding protein with serine-rich domain 1-B-like [Oncorhynchus keta]|uniref:RNA-binding protein with serine-rich domain 1-B-like n=1 Tax=Oncorhynchus keta TaxID=8018 RepID=UPI00227AC5F4|nr:RNA-binding protein with serine-rich domain 1-B-like [Oncorhynchus keta]
MKDEAKERNVTLAPVLPVAPVPPLPLAAPGLPAPDPPAPQGHPTSFAATTTTTNDHSPNPRRGVGGAPAPDPPRCTWADLTRNVIKGHIQEIFGTYRKIKMIDMPVDRLHPHLLKGYTYMEFEMVVEAEKGLKHMDGGQIDGQEIIAPSPLTGCLHNVATHPIPHKEKTPQLTRQLELLQVELPGTPDLTAPLLPHFSFLHWKSLYLKFYPASYQCVLPSNDH